MLKILIEKWDKNKKQLERKLKETKMDYEYKDLVKWTFQYIYNIDAEKNTKDLDIDNITEIDDGDYQGTLLYIIPFDTYQPEASEYLLTYVSYGSCSGCDTLLRIFSGFDYDDVNIGYYAEESYPSKSQLKDLMTLCLHILQHTIRPYRSIFEDNEEWEHLSIDEEE